MTIRRLAHALPILLFGWIATLSLFIRLGGEAPAAVVPFPFPSANLIENLPQDIAITSRSAISLSLRSEAQDLAERLHQSGAWLVLPAGQEACTPNVLRERPDQPAT